MSFGRFNQSSPFIGNELPFDDLPEPVPFTDDTLDGYLTMSSPAGPSSGSSSSISSPSFLRSGTPSGLNDHRSSSFYQNSAPPVEQPEEIPQFSLKYVGQVCDIVPPIRSRVQLRNESVHLLQLRFCAQTFLMLFEDGSIIFMNNSTGDYEEFRIGEIQDGKLVYQIFLDPTGNHGIISLKRGDLYYLHRRGDKVRRIETRFKNVKIQSVGWDKFLGNEISTSSFLLGSVDGQIFEARCDLRDGCKSFKPVCDLSARSFDESAVLGIEIEHLLGNGTTEFNEAYILLATSACRLYQFFGRSASFEDLFNQQKYQSGINFMEIFGTRVCPSLTTFRPKFTKDEISLADSFTLLTGAGIYHGRLTLDRVRQDDALSEVGLISYETEAKDYDPLPIGLCQLRHHVVLLYSDRVRVVCNPLGLYGPSIVPKEAFRSTIVFEKVFDTKSDDGGAALGIEYEPETKVVLVYTSRVLFKLHIHQEASQLWKAFLTRAVDPYQPQIKHFEQALLYAGDDPEIKDRVLVANADFMFAYEHIADHYDRAARIYAQTNKPLETIALQFIERDQYPSLRIFLTEKLKLIEETSRRKCTSFATEMRCLSTWITELFLDELRKAEAVFKIKSDAVNAKQVQTIRRGFEQFLRVNHRNLDRQTTYSMIAAHGQIDLLNLFADHVQDYERVVNHFISRRDFRRAIDVLANLTNSRRTNAPITSTSLLNSAAPINRTTRSATTAAATAVPNNTSNPTAAITSASAATLAAMSTPLTSRNARTMSMSSSSSSSSTSTANAAADEDSTTNPLLLSPGGSGSFRFGQGGGGGTGSQSSSGSGSGSNSSSSGGSGLSSVENVFYRVCPVLIRHHPEALVSVLIEADFLTPTKLIPALMSYQVLYRQRVRSRRARQQKSLNRQQLQLQMGQPLQSQSQSQQQAPDLKKQQVSVGAGGRSGAGAGGAVVGFAGVGSVEEENQAIRYLQHCVNVRLVKDPSLFAYLLKLYAEQPGDEDLRHFLKTTDGEGYYDRQFALRLCLENHQYRAAVDIFHALVMFEEAVDLALEHGEVESAQISANGPPKDDPLRKKLWLKIVKHVVEEAGDIAPAMEILRDSDNLLRIEDLLPFFPNFESMEGFSDEISESLLQYNKEIEGLQSTMESSKRTADSLRYDIRCLRFRYSYVADKLPCNICKKTQLSHRPFNVFPCMHAFHSDCLTDNILKIATPEKKEEIRQLIRATQEDRARKPSSRDPHADAELAARNAQKLEDIVASDCPFCGEMMVQSIAMPLAVTADRDEQRLWAIDSFKSNNPMAWGPRFRL